VQLLRDHSTVRERLAALLVRQERVNVLVKLRSSSSNSSVSSRSPPPSSTNTHRLQVHEDPVARQQEVAVIQLRQLT